jgi:hypothetical protein
VFALAPLRLHMMDFGPQDEDRAGLWIVDKCATAMTFLQVRGECISVAFLIMPISMIVLGVWTPHMVSLVSMMEEWRSL